MNTNATSSSPPDHAWVHERIAASLAAGLPCEEQSLFDAHIHNCPECFDAFTEARDADRWLLRAGDTLTPSPNLEQKILTNLREKTMKPLLFPLAKRAAIGLAAAVALAATGVFAQYVLHQNLLNNPLSKQLASADDILPTLSLTKSRERVTDEPNPYGLRDKLDSSSEIRSDSPKADIRSGNRELKTQGEGQLRLSGEEDPRDGNFKDQKSQNSNDETITLLRDTTRPPQLHLGQTEEPNKPVILYSGKLPLDIHDLRPPMDRAAQVKQNESTAGTNSYYQFSRDASNLKQTDTERATAEANAAALTDSITRLNGPADSLEQINKAKDDKIAKLQPQNVSLTQKDADLNRSLNEAATVSRFHDIAIKKLQEQLAAEASKNKASLVSIDGTTPVDKSPADATTQPSTTPPSSPTDTTTQSPDVAARKIIRSGDVEFEVRSFEDAYASVSSIVTEDGGYISSTSSDKIANGKVRGTIVVRVPPEKLDRLLLQLRALGDLKSQQIAANDVTKDYVDLESELRALRAMETRLIDLIKNGKGEVKDLVVAEKQLGEYRVRIEKIEGQIRYYNSQIAMATLNITAYEKDIQKPTAAFDQENVSLSMETEDVEKQYQASRKILDDAKARITDSELKKTDADQYAARINAEVPPDKADFVAAQLKQIGTVVSFNRDRKQTTTGGTGEPTIEVEHKPTQFSISLYNLANIAPRQTTSITVAVTDVDAAYRKVLALVRKPIPAEANADKLPPTGRIVNSTISGQQPEQMSADIRADIRADQADSVLDALKQTGETLAANTSENPDTANVTSAKRGIQLHLVNLAAVPPRETVALRDVAQNVPDAYNKLLASLQTLQSAGSARIISSQLTQANSQDIRAALAFEVRRDALPTIDKAFIDAGMEPLSKNITRSNDTANTLDSKVGFQITELLPADTLPPLRTTVLGLEVDNVEKSLDTLRASLAADSAKEIEYTLSREQNGQVIGRLIIETPIKNSPTLLAHIHDLHGNEKTNQVTKNTQLPETQFAKDRFELTLSSTQPIVDSEKGFSTTLRSAASSAVAALLWSLWLILTGLLFLAPFLTLGWIVQKFFRRRKPAPPAPTA